MNKGYLSNWREAFLRVVQDSEFAEPLKQASLDNDLRTWTSCLTAAVVRSCTQLTWQPAAKNHSSDRLPKIGQEYLGIDVMAFDAGSSAPWPFPVAAFELENDERDQRVAYSLWKVLCLRAELRVVFAYRTDWEQSRQLVQTLAANVVGGLRPEERSQLQGQTVLAIGNRGEGETFPWGYFKFWTLNANLGRFEKE